MSSRLWHGLWPPLTLTALVLGLWEAAVRISGVERAVFPTPLEVAVALGDQSDTLLPHIGTTLAETILGLLAGVILGLGIAIVVAGWSLARRALEPLLVVIQTVPPIVLAPLLVLALGFGWAPRIVVVILVVFFPVTIAAAGAFLSADSARRELAIGFGASRWQLMRHVTFPAALPAIFDGVRISAAYAVGAAAIAEQIGGARGGIGLFIARSQRNFRADQVLAGVTVIAVLSVALYLAIGWAARIAMPWHRPLHERTTA